MIVLLAAVLAGIAGWLWITPGDPAVRIRRARRRSPSLEFPPSGGHSGPLGLQGIQPNLQGTRPNAEGPSFSPWAASSPQVAGREPLGRRRPSRSEVTVASAAGLMAALAVGGTPGLVVGVVGFAIVLVVVRRREPSELRRQRARVTADLPLAADLMVACLRAGQPISGAIGVTVEAIGGPLGDRLAWVNGQLRLGAAPESAWQVLASERPLAPLARTMSRAALSGAPVADVLTRLADDSRQAARAASSAAAQRVGVQAVAPLGLCFLPAFVFLGIIPVVAGLAGEVLLP
jgi:Flp pilus assembly protein TadB